MPSALYRPLEQSFKEYNQNDEAEEDDDEGDYDPTNYHQHQHKIRSNLSHYVPLAARTGIPVPGTSDFANMVTGRSNSRSSVLLRRLLVFTLISIPFVYVFFLLPMTTSGNGADDSDGDEVGTDSTNLKILNESLIICNENYADTRLYINNRPRLFYDNLPVIYFVTPTYPRREQVPELTRLAHTLLHVPRLHWIVANDHDACNSFLDFLLNKFGIPYTHLASPMPSKFRIKKPAPRGVANRRAALKWLRQHNITTGILYFGDDDNTYDLKLFTEIRDTQRVSMFPVGLIADYAVSGPVVRKSTVVGFLDSWVADRRWPVDMAGFAVNLAYMALHPNASMPYKPGYEEDYFLRSMALKLNQIEPKGNNCTEILVWHTQTKSKKRPVVRISSEYLDERSNLGALFKHLEVMGVAEASDTEGPRAIISRNGKVKPHFFFLS